MTGAAENAARLGLFEFYSSDVGRKIITVTPLLAEEGGATGQQWAMANMPRILGIVQQRLRDECCSRKRRRPGVEHGRPSHVAT